MFELRKVQKSGSCGEEKQTLPAVYQKEVQSCLLSLVWS